MGLLFCSELGRFAKLVLLNDAPFRAHSDSSYL